MLNKSFASLFSILLLSSSLLVAQEDTAAKPEEQPEPKGYAITVEKSVECTDVKSQDRTGTCWCFAGASFLESELIRRGKGLHNISEMYIVKKVYEDKAQNYVLRQGKANFGQGALAHDFINTAGRHGFVPETVFSGLKEGNAKHDHGEMESLMATFKDRISGCIGMITRAST